MKLKQSLKDLLCYCESIYVCFNLNKLTPFHLWPPLDGTHEQNGEKQRNVHNKQERYLLQKTRV